MSDNNPPTAHSSDSERNSDRSDNFEEISEEEALQRSVVGDVAKPAGETEAFDIDDHLPKTVTLLESEHGVKVYLVGTVHFSRESQEDVAKIIRAVQPRAVMVELCRSRINILQLDEETLLYEAKNMSMQKIARTIRQNGVFNGIMYILLLNMSANVTEQLGMATGGEFRTALAEMQKVPACVLSLGDRPVQLTLQRALARLSWFQTFKLCWRLLTMNGPISKEDIEKCKDRDMLEEMLAEMTGEFPALGEVFVHERDIYLTYSLQRCALPNLLPKGFVDSRPVVGVVGLGHVPGIVKLWPYNQETEVGRVMVIPPQSLSSRVLRASFKLGMVALGGYLVYKYVSVPKFVRDAGNKALDRLLAQRAIGRAA